MMRTSTPTSTTPQPMIPPPSAAASIIPNTRTGRSNSSNDTWAMPPQPQPSNPRRKIEEALKMFDELQNTQISDCRDTERFRMVSTSAPAGNAPDDTIGAGGKMASTIGRVGGARPPPKGSSSVRRGNSTSSSSQGHAPTTSLAAALRREKELERKLQVSEAVMKKLHKRNQALATEVAELKQNSQQSQGNNNNNTSSRPTTTTLPPLQQQQQQQQPMSSTTSSSSSSPALTADNAAVVVSLQSKIATLEATIQQLKKSNLQQQQAAAAATTTTTLPAGEADKGSGTITYQLERLRAQYNELLEARLDAVAANESTAKINAEVKKFFVVLRKKLHEEMVDREVEKQMYNEKILALEERLEK
eukprot:PhM_4_TR11853/c0_g1_i1/m.65892